MRQVRDVVVSERGNSVSHGTRVGLRMKGVGMLARRPRMLLSRQLFWFSKVLGLGCAMGVRGEILQFGGAILVE